MVRFKISNGNVVNKLKKIKTKRFLGKLFILIGFPILLVGFAYQILTKISLARESQSSLESLETIKNLNNQENLPERIIIPSVRIDLGVRAARVVKGEWETFPEVASFGLGSAIPGNKGNSVISAHARWGLFFPLKNIKIGDKIYILTSQKGFIYKVDEIKKVSPKDLSVLAATENETLTLYTCSGLADTKRLIVIAKRVYD